MELIIGKRNSGKTLKALQQANGNPLRLIVCYSKDDVSIILHRAESLGYTIETPITFKQFLSKEYDLSKPYEFIIDDAQALLKYICNPDTKIHSVFYTEYLEDTATYIQWDLNKLLNKRW